MVIVISCPSRRMFIRDNGYFEDWAMNCAKVSFTPSR